MLRVGVADAAVDKGTERDADQPSEVARQDSKYVELAAGKNVNCFHRPDKAGGAEDQEGASFELSNHEMPLTAIKGRIPPTRFLSLS